MPGSSGNSSGFLEGDADGDVDSWAGLEEADWSVLGVAVAGDCWMTVEGSGVNSGRSGGIETPGLGVRVEDGAELSLRERDGLTVGVLVGVRVGDWLPDRVSEADGVPVGEGVSGTRRDTEGVGVVETAGVRDSGGVGLGVIEGGLEDGEGVGTVEVEGVNDANAVLEPEGVDVGVGDTGIATHSHDSVLLVNPGLHVMTQTVHSLPSQPSLH